MVSRSFHCEFSGFLELAVGCAKTGLKNYPIFLNWIHPVPGFNCDPGFYRPVNNHVGYVGSLDLGERGSIQFLIS